jgi:hypothetical protein
MKRFFAVLVLCAFLMSVMSVVMAQPGKTNSKPAVVKRAPVPKVVASKTIKPTRTRRSHKTTRPATCKTRLTKAAAYRATKVASSRSVKVAKPKATALKAKKTAAPKTASAKPVSPRQKK